MRMPLYAANKEQAVFIRHSHQRSGGNAQQSHMQAGKVCCTCQPGILREQTMVGVA